ncbi:protoheme IX farnesyltransferase [Desulfomicrobium norvegicum]|uniref:Protoheme IX farnesyltransferase n=2 Tax=Desulfomicrobium TaxID=898 RepID=A0A8G2C2K8_DESNO|nr:UbiA family prenyltransferase [Desulfomicrobium norvegicum]SFL66916.1 protoheme IX farnesyltransferase [Desulfomicrobium norvegicum]
MIRDIPSLTRPGISLAVGLSALAGYVMAAGALSGGGALFAGTFALSAAVSVLNQIQERGRDARMERTRNRPLASGRMSVVQGCLIFALLLALSATLLWSLLSWRALPVLLVVLGLYNGLYTLMKPVTGWAMIPGAACGALPFWIGWVAGGGGLSSIEPAYFFVFYFVWQMPHFWMLAEANADDYAAAGFPVPANSFSGFSRQAIPRIWALALAMIGGMAPLFGLATGPGQAYALATVCPAYALLAIFARARVLRLASDGFLAGVVLMIVAERLTT